MEEIKPNSNKYRQKQLGSGPQKTGERRLNKVVNAEIKKESEMSKLLHHFIATDSKTLKNYIVNDVLIPFIKKGIMDTVGMILYNSPNAGKNRGTNVSNITYGGNINAGYQGTKITQITKREPGFNYDKIRFETRSDAEAILNALNGTIEQYGIVSVLDLYDAVGISTDNYTADSYGWNNLIGSDILRGSDGFYLKLPNARPFK